MTFVGRQAELAALEKARTEGGFVPVYGRRRVGKSELIVHFMDGHGIYFVGKQAPGPLQIREFLAVAARATGEPLLAQASVSGWKEAVTLAVQRWPTPEKGPLVLALDEFQWMAAASPELPSVLQELWDRDWSKSRRVALILCGSFLGFMEREVLGRESPLFGRRTAQLHVRPFDHREAAAFHRGLSPTDLASIRAVCGGVPAYLRLWDASRSVAQNLASLFLDESAPLAREPDFLLREELRDLTSYHAVLMELAAGNGTAADIARATGLDPRTLNYHLGVLCDLGYASRRYPLTDRPAPARSVRYVLDDPLLRFWFRFIFPSQSLIRTLGPSRAYTEVVRPHFDSWMGGAFERLCREFLPTAYVAEGVSAAFSCGEYWDNRTQIDVVGLRQDGWTDLGECKWGATGSAAAELERKVALYPNARNATIGRRLFLRFPPRQAPDGFRVHSLDDIYRA
jgi:hypothetical protein